MGQSGSAGRSGSGGKGICSYYSLFPNAPRPTRDGNEVAPPDVADVVTAGGQAVATRTAAHSLGGHPTDPPSLARESSVACAAHPRRVAEARVVEYFRECQLAAVVYAHVGSDARCERRNSRCGGLRVRDSGPGIAGGVVTPVNPVLKAGRARQWDRAGSNVTMGDGHGKSARSCFNMPEAPRTPRSPARLEFGGRVETVRVEWAK